MASKRKRIVIAYREAGHAVVARALGIGVVGIAMFSTDGTNCAGTITPSAAYQAGSDRKALIKGLEIDAKIAFAGAVANYQQLGYSRLASQGLASDSMNLQSAAVSIALLMAGETLLPDGRAMQISVSREIHDSARQVCIQLQRETEALVVEHWSAIERVANALTVSDLLDQTELDRLIAGSGMNSWAFLTIIMSSPRSRTHGLFSKTS